LFGARREEVGVIDFDQCGLGYYLFDLSVVLRTLLPSWRRAGRPEGPRRRALEALLEGYADARSLPPSHEHLLRTFDVMQRAAAVNRTLHLRSSGTTQGQARLEAFLRQAVVRLQRGYLA
jgi:Ser/Thr protein kinase RdoA (MazF antagonist)